MIIERLTAVGTDGSRVMLWFDDGTKMKIPARIVTERGIYQGMSLSEEALSDLQDSVRKASAKDRAIRIVSTTAISEKELRRRLVRRGERAEDAEEAVDWLRDLGAVDDESMAKRIVQRALGKGYGENRIRQELYQKGIPREYWEEALANLPAMDEAIDRFLAQRFRGQTPDKKEIDRAIGALQRRGHSWEDIRRGVSRYQEQSDLYDFE